MTATTRKQWTTNRDATERRDPMKEFADRIVESLEAGVKPWIRTWDPNKCGGPQGPRNAVTGHRYLGINVLVLGMDMRAFQSGDPRWATYHQAQEAGWQVRKGEKSTPVFFYKPLEVEDEKAKDRTRVIPIMKTFAVFHASQIDGIPAYKPPTVEEAPWTRPEAADIILKNSGAIVRTGGDRAFYSPTTDHIGLPPENAFRGPPEWAATALHELGHNAESGIMPRAFRVPISTSRKHDHVVGIILTRRVAQIAEGFSGQTRAPSLNSLSVVLVM